MIAFKTFILDQHSLLIQLQFNDTKEAALSVIKGIIAEIEAVLEDKVLECVHTYEEIAVYFRFKEVSKDNKASVESAVRHVLKKDQIMSGENEIKFVPVCYDAPYGPDLNLIAEHNNLTKEEVITIHTRPVYRVLFTGFLPGFPYLEGMDESIACPRKREARKRIDAGSVGIAQDKTGIYPSSSPGGWQLIGKTPLPLFDPQSTPPTLFQSGDQLRFKAISSTEFERLKKKVDNHQFQIEKNPL